MSHVLAPPVQESGRIGQVRSMEEANVHVVLEDPDVAERRVLDARCRKTIMKDFSNVGAAASHAHKPRVRKCAKLIRLRGEPGRNCRRAFDRSVKSQKSRHVTKA